MRNTTSLEGTSAKTISGDKSIENIKTARARLVLKKERKKKLIPIKTIKILGEGLRNLKNTIAKTTTIKHRRKSLI